jgi:predicted ATP-grasp superfamily ATP-dependent carboligase
MTKTVLLTLGRLPKALELARSFNRAGWRVVIAEPFAWHVSRLSNAVAKSNRVAAPNDDREQYLKDILAIIKEQRIDLVLPVSEETMHIAALHGRLPPNVSMFAPPQDILLSLHDKHAFITRCQRYGLSAPQTHAAASREAAALSLEGGHVIKPVFSCSGRGVKICKQAAALAARDAVPDMIVQTFIPGQVYSSFSIAYEGRALVTSIYKGTVMSGTVSVAFERVRDTAAVNAWIDTFIAKSNHSGFISFDFVQDGTGEVYGIECNPRATSGVHFIHPDDLARAIVDPGNPAPIRFKSETLFQQFYPCLTETQKSVFNPDLRRNNLTNLLGAKDVIWRANDPLPFLLMPATSYKILALSIFKGLSFGEASTRDIEWTPPPH